MGISQKILITGGAGFIGSNLAHQLIRQGHEVTIFDNLSRSGCKTNLDWLTNELGTNAFKLVKSDIKDFSSLLEATRGVNRVYHLAGQVAVTSSVTNPRQDFEDNAIGTFNALEAARLVGDNPIFLFTSTNKVYGGMEDIEVIEEKTRYRYADLGFGIDEKQTLDFHSPYGCSKGTGDQYTRDYARIFGLRTVVIRQSCIYGYRQFGIEDQGWLAWFIIAALKNRPITIYGNGKQLRDILFIDDLLDLYELVIERIDITSGQIFNIGGGPDNTISIWSEFYPLLEKLLGHSITVQYTDWRPGDQFVYVSDIRKAKKVLGWQPQCSSQQGITKLYEWIYRNQDLFSHL
jgi:CDP-paratose 2-epimerase